MKRGNGNSLLNVSMGGEVELLSSDGLHENNLEAYTVVLSATVHVISLLFGGGSSISVIFAIASHRNINRYSYTLVVTFFLACCCLNFIWSPLEVADLIMFHYVQRHPCERFVATRTAIHLFCYLTISTIIVFVSVEGIIRRRNCFGRLLRKTWPMTSSVICLLLSVFLIVIFIMKCLQSDQNLNTHYIITDSHIRCLILALTASAFCIVTTIFIILSVLFLKEAIHWENGRPRLRRKQMRLEIPEFLISQSNACAENDGGYGRSHSGCSSPATQKFLVVRDPDTSSMKGDVCHVPNLPSNAILSTGNRLGINMAQVLGRRRHTICQISDSSSVPSTPMDAMARAKQYNYVRKFSVDISALQAQLQNPKIFRDAPYQSDIDLSRKLQSDISRTPVHKAMLPLKPLEGKLDEKDEKVVENVRAGAEHGSVGIHIPLPPVIMVSNDDGTPMAREKEIPNEIHGSREIFQEEMTPIAQVGRVVQKPELLNFGESTEEHTSVPTLEGGLSGTSETESEGLKLARLTLLMTLTFVLSMLPVVVTEVLDSRLSRHAFANISTCTLAISTIQTIIYPHLVASCDDVVHRATRELKRRVATTFACRSDTEGQTETSSSTGQL